MSFTSRRDLGKRNRNTQKITTVSFKFHRKVVSVLYTVQYTVLYTVSVLYTGLFGITLQNHTEKIFPSNFGKNKKKDVLLLSV